MEAYLVYRLAESRSISFLLDITVTIISGGISGNGVNILGGGIGEFPLLEFVERTQNGFKGRIDRDGLTINGI